MANSLAILTVVALLAAPALGGLVDGFFQKAFDQLRPGFKDIYQENANLSQQLTLLNLFVKGLDKFYTVALSANLLPLKLNNLTIMVDEVKAESSYRMDMMTLPGPIVVSGAGYLDLHMTGIRLYTQATLGSKGGKIFIKDILEIQLTVKTLEIMFTGLEGGDSVGELIGNIINKVACRLFNLMASQVLFTNRAKLVPEINKLLANIKT